LRDFCIGSYLKLEKTMKIEPQSNVQYLEKTREKQQSGKPKKERLEGGFVTKEELDRISAS
jgi:hypothetical protein